MSLSSLAKKEIKLPRRKRRGSEADVEQAVAEKPPAEVADAPPAEHVADATAAEQDAKPAKARKSLKAPKLAAPKLLRRGRTNGRRTDHGVVVGLDIQPGEVIAAQVRLDGGIVVERAVAGEIDHNIVREGEVAEPVLLGSFLKDFFAEHELPTNVRVGLASRRAVMRFIDLPPLTDASDIAAAVQIQAPEHIAMPLDRAVLDHQVVGPVDTANGPRTRVLVVAAQQDSISKVLAATSQGGLKAVGVDLSAFALTRAMYTPSSEEAAPVLYAHVGGVTTVAIARGNVCELTRVSPVGLEQLSAKLAERDGVTVHEARTRLIDFDPDGPVDELALTVLDAGLAELADDLEKTITFHASQSDGAAVMESVISGTGAAIPNFAEVLGQRMRMPVRRGAPVSASNGAAGNVTMERAALAAGLAVEDVTS
jgi:type IV pilus assembly protein PilM